MWAHASLVYPVGHHGTLWYYRIVCCTLHNGQAVWPSRPECMKAHQQLSGPRCSCSLNLLYHHKAKGHWQPLPAQLLTHWWLY